MLTNMDLGAQNVASFNQMQAVGPDQKGLIKNDEQFRGMAYQTTMMVPHIPMNKMGIATKQQQFGLAMQNKKSDGIGSGEH